MTRTSRCLLLAVALAAPAPALAQARPTGPGTAAGGATSAAAGGLPANANGSGAASPEDQAKAQQHFQRAKDLYQAGSYRDAITELESARALDPKAKELVFNLGIVHEKLARFDEAITLFRQYLEMEGVTAAERGKAESIIKRIEGAKREVPPTANGTSDATEPGADGNAAGALPPVAEAPPKRGRIDAATVVTASVGAVGLVAGATFGILALATKPSDGVVTGPSRTYASVVSDADRAHTFAIVSDVGLVVGVLGAAAAAYLYFGRTKDRTPAPASGPVGAGSVRFTASAAPMQDGAMFGAVGTFR